MTNRITKPDYDAMLASALVKAAMAVRSLREDTPQKAAGLPEGDGYSFEMLSIMDMTKRLGASETEKLLRYSFEAGNYEEIFRMQLAAPPSLPYAVSCRDGSYYCFGSIDEAAAYFFSLPEDVPHYMTYDTVIAGTEHRLTLFESKNRHVETADLDGLAQDLPAIRELYGRMGELAEKYIQPDFSVADYGGGRCLTVSWSEAGYEYKFFKDGVQLLSGEYPHPELSTYGAEKDIHELIFERGISPDTGLPFARVNSAEFINMLGMPPYEGRHTDAVMENNKTAGETYTAPDGTEYVFPTDGEPGNLIPGSAAADRQEMSPPEAAVSKMTVPENAKEEADRTDTPAAESAAEQTAFLPARETDAPDTADASAAARWGDDEMRMLADDLCEIIFKGEDVSVISHEDMYRLLYNWDASRPDCVNIRLGVTNAAGEHMETDYEHLKAEEVLRRLDELPVFAPEKDFSNVPAPHIQVEPLPGDGETTVLTAGDAFTAAMTGRGNTPGQTSDTVEKKTSKRR